MTSPNTSAAPHANTPAHDASTQTRDPHVGAAHALTEGDVSARLGGAPDRMLDVGHAQLAYYRFGQGPDLVCVHGWPLHAATFRRVVPHLARDFTVHLLDLPGTGQSVWDERSHIDLVAHGASVRRATELLGLTRFAYLGHDSGAAISRLAAADDPRVFAHVMADTEIPGHTPWQLNLYALTMRVPGLIQLVMRALSIGAFRRSALGFGGCFTDPRYVDGDFGAWFVQPLATDPHVLAGQLRLLKGLDPDVLAGLRSTHAQLSAPSLLLWGSDDPFFPVSGARAMLPQFPAGAELVTLPRARLFPHEDHPEAFSAATRAFLLRHAAAD
ncbi:MAG: alpha/beta hydrolase [Polyangiales bacterium]